MKMLTTTTPSPGSTVLPKIPVSLLGLALHDKQRHDQFTNLNLSVDVSLVMHVISGF